MAGRGLVCTEVRFASVRCASVWHGWAGIGTARHGNFTRQVVDTACLSVEGKELRKGEVIHGVKRITVKQ